MVCVLTGGAGFIGSVLATMLVEQGHEVKCVDNFSRGINRTPGTKLFERDIAKDDIRDILEGTDVVFNLAAKVHITDCENDRDGAHKDNVETVHRLIKQMNEVGIKSLVHASTGGVYGQTVLEQIPESSDKKPDNIYSQTKLLAEEWIEISENINYTIFRFFNVIGSYKGIMEQMEGCEHIIPAMMDCLVNNKQFTVNGVDYETRDGTTVRDYIHVEDICKALILGGERLFNNREIETKSVYNLGTEEGTTIKELIRIAQKYGDLEVVEGPRRKGDSISLVCNSSKVQEALGWKPKREIKDGMMDVMQVICSKKIPVENFVAEGTANAKLSLR